MSDKRDDAKLPPIPDGGLTESMPDWLRRPPAWRTLQDREVVQTQPAESSQLPDADTSEIDPRTFLTEDDLPSWLRNMGWSTRPAATPSSTDATAAPPQGNHMEARPGDPPRPPEGSAGAPTRSARFVPRKPPVPTTETRVATRRPVAASRTPSGSQRHASPPWWQGTPVVLVLGGLLVIALLVIVLLVVA